MLRKIAKALKSILSLFTSAKSDNGGNSGGVGSGVAMYNSNAMYDSVSDSWLQFGYDFWQEVWREGLRDEG